MKFLWLNHIQNAHDSLKSNKTRTGLTIIGISIGISSIVAALSLGAGASTIVRDQVDALEGNIAIVRPSAPETTSLESVASRQPHTSFTTSTLTEADVFRIQAIRDVKAVAPLMLIPGSIRGDGETRQNSLAVASTPELFAISDLRVSSGQALDATTSDATAVIGAQLAIDLYGTEHAIGKIFTLRGEQFRVIGTLQRQNNPINYNGVNFDTTALISLDAGRNINQQVMQIQQINIQSTSVERLNQVISDVSDSLVEEHDGEYDFAVISGEDIAEPNSELFFAIASAVAVIAGISLLVGGIGVMNIMLVNVAERTREIGIRKSLGATRSDIVWQFLIESLVLSVIGGFVGIGVGYGLAFFIGLMFTFDPTLSWQIIVVAIGVAAVVGVLFGLYPAIRAAKKRPIESLRQYS